MALKINFGLTNDVDSDEILCLATFHLVCQIDGLKAKNLKAKNLNDLR